MVDAQTIADYLILLASEEDEYEPMTHLRLQKLLYYVQGWSLAMRGNPAFRDEIQAWKDGPVVPQVFQAYTHLQHRPISQPKIRTPCLDDELRGFIHSIWESYKEYSATALRSKTHREAPWLTARGSTPPGKPSQEEITHESMLTFFRDEFEQHNQFETLSIEHYRQSEKALRSRRGTRFADIR